MNPILVTPQRQATQLRVIVGLNSACQMGHQQGIPAQWNDCNATGPPKADPVAQAWYAVCHGLNGAGGFATGAGCRRAS